MMETNPHAFGVDEIACLIHSRQTTPSAWMMAL
jgi:hypothetical protein